MILLNNKLNNLFNKIIENESIEYYIQIIFNFLNISKNNITKWTYIKLFLFIISIYIILKLIYKLIMKIIRINKMNMPKVKGGLPFIGQALNMIKTTPWDLMCEWVDKYGPIVRFDLLGRDCVILASPESISEVMKHQYKNFSKDLPFTYDPFLVILGNGIVTSDGKNWMHQRLQVSGPLRVHILQYIPAMTMEALKKLFIRLDKKKAENGIIEMGEEFRHITLQVIAKAILSLDGNESDETFAKMYLPIVTECNLRVWYPYRKYLPNKEFNDNVNNLNNYIVKLIKERWEKRKDPNFFTNRREDILDRILNSIKEDEFTTKTIKLLRDQIKTFILAGHETSASMLTWALYELSRNDNLANEVRNEAYDIFGDDPDILPDFSIISGGLKFTLGCLKEALRKYSNVPTVTRKALKDTKICNYYIPKGTTIMLGLQAIHHRHEYWPKPDEYDPHRYDDLKKIKPFTFVPFIEGPRNCMGQFLSLMESKVILSQLLLRYNFEPINKVERHPWMVPVIPKDGLYLRVS